MPITDPLVLPVDVVIAPVERLPTAVRARLGASDGMFAVTRPHGRAPSRLVTGDGAALLEEFRRARRVADAVLGYAGRRGLEPALVLADSFPLLRDCFNARVLVPADSPDAAPILPTREPGNRIGRFAIRRCVQALEDTEVYLASGLEGEVALKLARPGSGPGVAAALAREASALRRLGGAGAPAFVAAGRTGRQPWIAMEWRHGATLDTAFAGHRDAGDLAELAALAARVAAAYAALHRRGVLHGDVHAANLLVEQADRIAILDFGLARAIPPARLAGRPGAGFAGSILAPERASSLARGRSLPAPTPATEQHDVAAMLYALVTGQPPLDLPPEREAALRVLAGGGARPFTAVGAGGWRDLEGVLRRALAPEPGDRHPSMAALSRALRAVRPPRRSRPPVAAAELARVVNRFLDATRLDGAAFREGPPPPRASVTHGRAGIAWALYRLACLRDDADLLARADAWLARAEAPDPLAFEAPGSDLLAEEVGPVSPYHARPGADLVRALIARAQGDERSATAAAGRFIAGSRQPWVGHDLTLGSAGTLLGAALLAEAGVTAPDSALAALGEEVAGPLAARSPDPVTPGIAHGEAGVLYALLRWSAAIGRPAPPQLGRRLEALAARAERAGRGARWGPPGGADRPADIEPHEAAGWCRGPAGLVHLWILAAERTRDAAYPALAEASGWTAWDATSRNPNLCCGLAGRGFALLELYRYSGNAAWAARARVLAHRAAAEAAGRGGLLPLGLFKGLAGIALLAAELDRPEEACAPLFGREGWPNG